jgi:DNA modification methylase
MERLILGDCLEEMRKMPENSVANKHKRKDKAKQHS